MTETREQAMARYRVAAHAMQTGVAFANPEGTGDQTPKHLRVGVNSAMVEHSALAHLLMRKGVITEEEYYTALADGMEQEAERYRSELQARHPGTKITLG